jgi:hypothetical protein
MLQKNPISNAIALTYYSFTTLATVGLGDYHPYSNLERFFCAFIMLFGVMTLSLLLGNFGNAIKDI